MKRYSLTHMSNECGHFGVIHIGDEDKDRKPIVSFWADRIFGNPGDAQAYIEKSRIRDFLKLFPMEIGILYQFTQNETLSRIVFSHGQNADFPGYGDGYHGSTNRSD